MKEKTSIGETFKKQFVAIMITVLIAIGTAFSDKIAESLSVALNSAEQRFESYNVLAKDLSSYLYYAEVVIQFYRNNLATREALEMIIPLYRDATKNVLEKEFVHLAAVHRYWGKSMASKYKVIMSDLREFDRALYLGLNPAGEEVYMGKRTKADPAITKPVTDKLLPMFYALRGKVSEFLPKLD